jgi:hypothetical protein
MGSYGGKRRLKRSTAVVPAFDAPTGDDHDPFGVVLREIVFDVPGEAVATR